MPVVGLFGISNDGLNLAVNLLVVLLVVVYLALIVWTFLDARRRIEDPGLVACATAASLFPFVGAIDLLDPPPAGVHRGPQGARARDPRLRAARPAARASSRAPTASTRSSATTCAARTAEARLKDPCPTLPEADRPPVGDVPLLRDAGALALRGAPFKRAPPFALFRAARARRAPGATRPRAAFPRCPARRARQPRAAPLRRGGAQAAHPEAARQAGRPEGGAPRIFIVPPRPEAPGRARADRRARPGALALLARP